MVTARSAPRHLELEDLADIAVSKGNEITPCTTSILNKLLASSSLHESQPIPGMQAVYTGSQTGIFSFSASSIAISSGSSRTERISVGCRAVLYLLTRLTLGLYDTWQTCSSGGTSGIDSHGARFRETRKNENLQLEKIFEKLVVYWPEFVFNNETR